MREKLLFIFIIFIVVFASIALKLKDYNHFLNSNNALSTHDAYRYARYALEIKSSTYSKIDYLSDIPDFKENQNPPPLLSQLSVWLSQISGIEIEYFFIFMPPILSVFFILPFYFWLKPIFNFYVFIGGIILTVFSLNYYARTTLGYFDTDCLMLFFIFLITASISNSAQLKEDKMRSYYYVFLSALFLIIFRWWYDHLFMNIFFLISLLISLVVWKHSIKEILFKLIFFIVILNPIELFHYIFLSPFIKDYVLGNILDIQSYKMAIDVYSTIAENKPVSLDDFINQTTGNIFTLIIGSAFFFICFVKNYKYIIPALPFILIGLSVFYTGYRYLIFTAPFIGMGIGYSVYVLKEFTHRRLNLSENMSNLYAIILVLILSFPLNILHHVSHPLFSDREVRNLEKIKDLTEKNAYIWSWWDIGNPIQYLAGKGVFLDNTTFSQHKLMSIFESFTANNEDASINAFKKVKKYNTSLTSEEILRFNNPVYFFLNDTMLRKAIAKGFSAKNGDEVAIKRKFPSFRFVCNIDNNTADCDGLTINVINNMIKVSDSNIRKGYNKIVYFNKENNHKTELLLNTKTNVFMVFIYTRDKQMHQIIAHNDFENTMIFKMLIASEDNFKHFKLVYEDFPYMVLYKVK